VPGHLLSPTLAVAILACVLSNCLTIHAQIALFERPPVNYPDAEVHDAVARLAAKVESGEVKLDFERQHGYLKSVLASLDVPVSSQALVFSKTSMQIHRISPQQPRAIYFNDDVYVGWCQRGEVLELAATDAKQGAIFYSLKQTSEGPPVFVRDRGQCLTCHASSRTQNVPGYFVRSVFAERSGQPALGSGTFTTDVTSPFEERWGGWYVTGTHGSMRHMGNAIFNPNDRILDRETGANLKTLDGVVSTKPYLSPHSDLVALMVLEHQTQMHNAITAANFETRQALHQSFEMNDILDREPGSISDSANRRIDAVVENAVSHLLMCEEFTLASPVSGTSEFASEFMARGVRDSKGRSLADLDLQTRLFRYPCSFLVYSEAFDGLPDEARARIVSRLTDILENRDDSEKFAHLTPEMRREVLDILRETKPQLWTTAPAPPEGSNETAHR